jgi:hypothetical protein
VPIAALEARQGACARTPMRIGGAFEKCADGGVYVGYGDGEWAQVRVMPRGEAFDMDEPCATALDDGSPVEVPAAKRLMMLRTTLNLDKLSPHWHPDLRGRDPLRIVRSPYFPDPPEFNMFGDPVVWIDAADAKQGTAYFEITALTATKTRARIEFRYPVEGIDGNAVFSRGALRTSEVRKQ